MGAASLGCSGLHGFTGLSVDRTGGYLGSTLAFVVMCGCAALFASGLRPPASPEAVA